MIGKSRHPYFFSVSLCSRRWSEIARELEGHTRGWKRARRGKLSFLVRAPPTRFLYFNPATATQAILLLTLRLLQAPNAKVNLLEDYIQSDTEHNAWAHREVKFTLGS